MAPPLLVSVLLVLALFAGQPAAAEAGGVKIIVGSGPVFHPFPLLRPPVAFSPHPFLVRPPAHIFIVPRPAFIVVPRPTFIASSPPCYWIPGYWASQWIPQSYTSDVWVPGQWSPDGTWIEGHYEPQTVSTGSYQPLWVEGRCIQY